MAMEWFSCKGACTGSDPASDTVKVDVSRLASEKENVQPLQVSNKADQLQKEQDEKKRAQEEFLRKQKEAQQRQQAEEQARIRREEEEAARRQKEQAAADRAAAEKAAAAAEAAAVAKAQEEALRREAERAAAVKAQEEREAAERAALEAQKCEELRLAQEKVNVWCKANGFSDMSAKKKSFMSGTKHPLHEAVAQSNEEIVGLLVQLGVDKEVKNSKGLTAKDVAIKINGQRNKAGSMDSIIAKLH